MSPPRDALIGHPYTRLDGKVRSVVEWLNGESVGLTAMWKENGQLHSKRTAVSRAYFARAYGVEL